jgi:predicted porin
MNGTFLKRALCLAMLGMAAGAAQAQFDHSFYGVADFSYGRFEPSGTLREHRFNSNSMTATFGGATASYGFENGWTPGITLEAFYRLHELKGGRNDNDPLLSRNAFVSLTHRDWGTLRAGRMQSLLFSTAIRFNALSNSVAFSPAIRHIFAAGNIIGVQGDFYWNQALGYTSPNLEGFTASAIAARGESNDPGRLTGGTLVFSRGVFATSLSVQRVDVDNGVDDPTDETAWQLGGSYNFGWAQLFGQITQTRDRGLDVRSDIVSLGASAPLGPGSVQVQFAISKADGPAVARKQTTTSAAYVVAFDSVTDLYLVAMDDRVRGQTRGVSAATGVRRRF